MLITPATYQLKTFGGLHLVVSGGPQMELSRRRLALLALLAASSGRGVPRERLITYLWPDTLTAGKHSLEQLLSTVRGRLGQDTFSGIDPIQLNPAVISSDIDAFGQALDQGDPARAVGLYQGPFLDGFYLDGLKEFEEWTEAERARYAGRYIDSLTELAIAAQNRGDLGSAVAWWRQLVLADPLRTQGALGLMKALAAAGDRAAAIQHARIHEDLLKQQFDLAVDPAVTALKDQLQTGVAGPAVNQKAAAGTIVPAPFAAPDEAGPVLSEVAESTGSGGTARARSDWYGKVAVGGTVVAVAAIGLGLWGWLEPTPPEPVRRYRLAVPAGKDLRNSILAPALAPDGSRWVFVGSNEDGKAVLYLQARHQVAPTAIPGTEAGINPFFSPDGRRVAFITSHLLTDPRPTELRVVGLGGEAPVTLARDLGTLPAGPGSWSRDGYLYVTTAGRSILRVPEAGGIPDTVSTIDRASGETGHGFPEALPGGKGIVFSVFHGRTPEERDIAVLDLATGKHTILTRGLVARYALSGHLVFVTSEGTLWAAPFDADRLRLAGSPVALGERVAVRGIIAWIDLALSANGTLLYLGGPPGPILSELVWVGRDGKTTPIDSNWVTDFESLALSPDGTRLAAAIGAAGAWPETERHIWSKRLDHGPAVKLTFEGNPNHHPAWSPDGNRIAFLSERGGRRELYTHSVDGSTGETRLLGLDRQLDEVVWSRDGRWLILGLGTPDDRGRDIVAIRPGIDSAPIPIVATPADEKAPTLSPDGRFIAYASNESGRSEVYVRPFPDADRARWQVSTDGGSEPLWSNSGRELFYRSALHQMAAEIRTQPGLTIEDRRQLFRLSGFKRSDTHRAYDVAPDDQRFIMIRVRTKDDLELLLVENWFSELTEKVRKH